MSNRPLVILMALLIMPMMHRMYARRVAGSLFGHKPLNHIAFIMDGNRRWAQKHRMANALGHKQGAQTIKMVLSFCVKHQIKIVSVYAFSLENFKRSPEEVSHLFELIVNQAQAALPEFKAQNIKVCFLGALYAAPEDVQRTITQVEQETASCTGLTLNVLLCYGGRQELLHAIGNIVQDVKNGTLTEAPTEEVFRQYLWTKHVPDPDLIIRTGGVQRLSNFLTYQTSYSELIFTHRLWPELTAEDLDLFLEEYSHRTRNFGA